MKMIAFFFLLYIGWCFLAAIFGWDVGSNTDTHIEEQPSESEPLFDKVYSDGSYRVKGPLGTNYYSDGKTSYTGFWGEEVQNNGETVTQNGWVYDKNGNHIGYEYEDILGITHRDVRE